MITDHSVNFWPLYFLIFIMLKLELRLTLSGFSSGPHLDCDLWTGLLQEQVWTTALGLPGTPGRGCAVSSLTLFPLKLPSTPSLPFLFSAAGGRVGDVCSDLLHALSCSESSPCWCPSNPNQHPVGALPQLPRPAQIDLIQPQNDTKIH